MDNYIQNLIFMQNEPYLNYLIKPYHEPYQ